MIEVFVMEEDCKKLWVAVLAQAVKDARSKHYTNRDSALSWLRSKNQGFASFLWVCSILGFDPDLIRMSSTTPISSDMDVIDLGFHSLQVAAA